MSTSRTPDFRSQIRANLKVLFPNSDLRMDVITLKDDFKSSYQAVVVEFSDSTKESKILILSDSNMTSRDLAYSDLLEKTEVMAGAKLHKCVDGDVSFAHIENIKEKHDREEYEFVESPSVTAPADVRVVPTSKYNYPPGSGDEWAYYASAHLKAQKVTSVPPPLASKSLITPNQGCPLGTDDEWMYWWTKSLEDDDKAAAPATNAVQSELFTPSRGCPNGSKDEWAYWAQKSVEDKKRCCPRGTNDEWAYWVAESLKKGEEVKRTTVHKRARTPTRKCPYGTDDQWAYWAWRHSEAKSEGVAEMETKVEEKVEVNINNVKDFPPGSGDLWAHFDKMFRDRKYAEKYQDVSVKDQVVQSSSTTQEPPKMSAPASKSKLSAYALWAEALNIE